MEADFAYVLTVKYIYAFPQWKPPDVYSSDVIPMSCSKWLCAIKTIM